MKIGRIAAFIVALLAVSAMVYAGGQQDGATAAGTQKIVVKAMGYGNNANQEGQTWTRIVDAFERANPNVDIDDELLYDEAYHQKVVARLAAGDVPDFAYMGGDARWGRPWAEAGQQFDHRPFIDANAFDLSLIPPMGPNGEIWEIPLGTTNICTVLFVNKALVKQLGFDVPKTYEDIVAMVPAAKAAGLEVIAFNGADAWPWGTNWYSMLIGRLSGETDWVTKAVNGQYKFTDKPSIDALKFVQRMVADGVLSKNSVLVDQGSMESTMSNRKALMMYQGHWEAGNLDPSIISDLVLIPFPKIPGEKANMAGSIAGAISVGYGVTKKGAEVPAVRDAALKFIMNFFYSEPEVTQRLRDGGIVAPILKNYQAPADLPEVIKQKIVLANSAKVTTEVEDSIHSGASHDALMAGMQRIVSGTATPEQVAAEVEALLRK